MSDDSSNPYDEGDDSVNTPEWLRDVEVEAEDVEDHGDDPEEEPEHDSYP